MRKLIRESSEKVLTTVTGIWSALWLMTFVFSVENEKWMVANFIVILLNFAITYNPRQKLLTVVHAILSGAYILLNWQFWVVGDIGQENIYTTFVYSTVTAVTFILLLFRFGNEPMVDE